MKNDHQNRPHDSFFEDILEKGSLEKYTTNKHHFFDIEIDATDVGVAYDEEIRLQTTNNERKSSLSFLILLY